MSHCLKGHWRQYAKQQGNISTPLSASTAPNQTYLNGLRFLQLPSNDGLQPDALNQKSRCPIWARSHAVSSH
eukprot:1159765-Pelagomonas_calceolata.AAC.28